MLNRFFVCESISENKDWNLFYLMFCHCFLQAVGGVRRAANSAVMFTSTKTFWIEIKYDI